jgi:hypothetical protein
MAAPFVTPLFRGRRGRSSQWGFAAGWQRGLYVDSGAAYSIVSAQLANAVGFDFKRNAPVFWWGDGHCLPVYLHRLPRKSVAAARRLASESRRTTLHFNL